MNPSLFHSILPAMPAAVIAGGSLLLSVMPASAQRIYNDEHTFSEVTEDWRPDPIYIGFGEGEDGTVNLEKAWIDVGPDNRFADADGTGTGNTAILNIDANSRFTVASGGRDSIGYDGTAVINVDGTQQPDDWDPDATHPGQLRTRQAELGSLPGSSGTVNLIGPYARWDPFSWHVDVGVQGAGEINVLDGAQMTNAQRLVIGGTRYSETTIPEAGGTGTLNVDGEGSHISFSSSPLAFFGIGRRGVGTVIVSNGGEVYANHPNREINLWVGNQEGGDGTLIVESGGRVITSGVFRVNSDASDRGYVRVDGAGSELRAIQHPDESATGHAFVGNTGLGEDPIGVVDIVNGGLISIERYMRIGNQEGATGDVTVEGAGSTLNVDRYLQVGWNGEGSLRVSDGGRVEVPLESGSVSSVGRSTTGVGMLTVEGAGSEAVFPRLFLGADTFGDPTGGVGTVNVRDDGHLLLGGHLVVRGGSVVDLDGGTITMEHPVESRPNVTDVGGDGSLLTGTGVLDSNLVVTDDGSVIGLGEGIDVLGALYAGSVDNVTLSSIEAAVVSDDDRAFAGPSSLNNVRFADGATINITINDFEEADNLISFDGETDFDGVELTISFVPSPPPSDWSARLFDFTGADEGMYAFASVDVPDGWVFEDGMLYHQDPGSDPSVFELWASGYGLSGSEADPEANPAGDGFSNLSKFAFGADPTVSTASLATFSRDGNLLVLRWNQRSDGSIAYEVETTTGLGSESWEPVPGAEPEVMAEPDVTPPDGYERVEWSVDIDGDSARTFYRARSDVDAASLP